MWSICLKNGQLKKCRYESEMEDRWDRGRPYTKSFDGVEHACLQGHWNWETRKWSACLESSWGKLWAVIMAAWVYETWPNILLTRNNERADSRVTPSAGTGSLGGATTRIDCFTLLLVAGRVTHVNFVSIVCNCAIIFEKCVRVRCYNIGAVKKILLSGYPQQWGRSVSIKKTVLITKFH